MVGTRSSRSNDLAAPVSDEAEIPKELRRLHIDGKDTMRGEARKQEEVEIYWWRGAKYVRTKDTPQEWADAEKDKHHPGQAEGRKRKRTFEEELIDNGGEEDEQEDERPNQKRKSMGAFVSEREVEHQRMRKDVKRARQSFPKMRPTSSSSQQQEVRTSPRRTRSESHAQRESPEKARTESYPQRETPPLRFDYSLANSDDLSEYINDKREEARDEGLEVDALPVSAPSISTPTLEPVRKPSVGYETFIGLKQLAKVNKRIARLQEQYGKMKASKIMIAMRKQREARRNRLEQVASPAESETVKETIEEQLYRAASMDDEELLQAQLTAAMEEVPDSTVASEETPDPIQPDEHEDELTDTLPESGNALASPIATPELESDSSNFDRHDSAAASSSVGEPSHTTVASASSIEDLSTAKSTPLSELEGQDSIKKSLPRRNRAGNKLRWSIGESATTSSPCELPELRLTEHRDSEDRAEASIFTGRMSGESRQSRRRRVKRERQMLRTLGFVETEGERRRATLN